MGENILTMRFKSLFTKSNSNIPNGNGRPLDIPPQDARSHEGSNSSAPSIIDYSNASKDKSSSSSPLPSRSSVQDSVYSNATSLEPTNSPSSNRTKQQHQIPVPSNVGSPRRMNPPRSNTNSYAGDFSGADKMQTFQYNTSDSAKHANFSDLPTQSRPNRNENFLHNQAPVPNHNGLAQNAALKAAQHATASFQAPNGKQNLFHLGLDPNGNPLLQPPRSINKKPYSKSPDQRSANARRSQPPMSLQKGSSNQPVRSPQIPEHPVPPRSASVTGFSRPPVRVPSRDQLHSIELLDTAEVPIKQSRNRSHSNTKRVKSPVPSISSSHIAQSPIPDIPSLGPAPSRSRFQQQAKPRLPSASQISEFNQAQSAPEISSLPKAGSRQSVILHGNEMDNHLASASSISMDNLIPAVNGSKFAPPGSRIQSIHSASYTSLRSYKPVTPNMSTNDSEFGRSPQHFMPSPKNVASPPHGQYPQQLASKNKSKSALDLRAASLSPNSLKPTLSPTIEGVSSSKSSPRPSQTQKFHPQPSQAPKLQAQLAPTTLSQKGKKIPPPVKTSLKAYDNSRLKKLATVSSPTLRSYDEAGQAVRAPPPPIPVQVFMEPPPRSPSRKKFPSPLQLYPNEVPELLRPSPISKNFDSSQSPNSPGSLKSSASNSTYGPASSNIINTGSTAPTPSSNTSNLQSYPQPMANGTYAHNYSTPALNQTTFNNEFNSNIPQPVTEVRNAYTDNSNAITKPQQKLQPSLLPMNESPNPVKHVSREATPTVTILGSLDDERDSPSSPSSEKKLSKSKSKRMLFWRRGVGSASTPDLASVVKVIPSSPSASSSIKYASSTASPSQTPIPTGANGSTSSVLSNSLSTHDALPKNVSSIETPLKKPAAIVNGGLSPTLRRSSSTQDSSNSIHDTAHLPQINESKIEPVSSPAASSFTSVPKTPETQRSSWRRKSSIRSHNPSVEGSSTPDMKHKLSKKKSVSVPAKPEGPFTKSRFNEVFNPTEYGFITEQWEYLQNNLGQVMNRQSIYHPETDGFDAVFDNIVTSLNLLSPLLSISWTEWGLTAFLQSEMIRNKAEAVKNIRMTNGNSRAQESKEKELELAWVEKGVGLISSIPQISPHLFTLPQPKESTTQVYSSLDPSSVNKAPEPKPVTVSKYPAPPTAEYLLKATPDSTCPVCMEQFTDLSKVIVLPCCLHIFHASPCLVEWVTAPKHKRRRGRDRSYEARMSEYTEDLGMDLARARGTVSRRQAKYESRAYEFSSDRAILREIKTGFEGHKNTLKKKQSTLNGLNKGGLIGAPGESSFTAKSFAKSFKLVKQKFKDGNASSLSLSSPVNETSNNDSGTSLENIPNSSNASEPLSPHSPSPPPQSSSSLAPSTHSAYASLASKAVLDSRLARKIERCAVTMDGAGDDDSMVDEDDPAKNLTLTNGCPMCRATFDSYL